MCGDMYLELRGDMDGYPMEYAEFKWEARDLWEAFLRSTELRLMLREGDWRKDLIDGGRQGVLAKEWLDCEAAREICIAEDEANDDLTEDKTEDATDAGVDESRGVDSEGGGSLRPVLASRLQTGQKVLHEVSQESTQAAWNSVNKQIRKKMELLWHFRNYLTAMRASIN